MKIECGSEEERTGMTSRGISAIVLLMIAAVISGCGNRADDDSQDMARSVQLDQV